MHVGLVLLADALILIRMNTLSRDFPEEKFDSSCRYGLDLGFLVYRDHFDRVFS